MRKLFSAPALLANPDKAASTMAWCVAEKKTYRLMQVFLYARNFELHEIIRNLKAYAL